MITKMMPVGRSHADAGKSIRFLSGAVAEKSPPQPNIKEVSRIHSDVFGDSPLKPKNPQWYYAFHIPQKVRREDCHWTHVYLFKDHNKQEAEAKKRFYEAIHYPTVAVALPVSPEGKFDADFNAPLKKPPLILSTKSDKEPLKPDLDLNFNFVSDPGYRQRHTSDLCNSLLLGTDHTHDGKPTILFSEQRIGHGLRRVLVDFYGWML